MAEYEVEEECVPEALASICFYVPFQTILNNIITCPN